MDASIVVIIRSLKDSLRCYIRYTLSLGIGNIRVDKSRNQCVYSPVRKMGEKMEWEALRNEVSTCTGCSLYQSRNRVVFGEGNLNADVVFIGEAPGRNEDLQGLPFVGRAGQLLNRMLQAMNLSREQVFICNILKCRPPNNRDPIPEEIDACEGYLKRQLELIQPIIIVALGRYSAQCLLKTGLGLNQLRGKFHQYQGIEVMPTYHPAALLRNPSLKRNTWNDLQQVMAALEQNKDRSNTGHTN